MKHPEKDVVRYARGERIGNPQRLTRHLANCERCSDMVLFIQKLTSTLREHGTLRAARPSIDDVLKDAGLDKGEVAAMFKRHFQEGSGSQESPDDAPLVGSGKGGEVAARREKLQSAQEDKILRDERLYREELLRRAKGKIEWLEECLATVKRELASAAKHPDEFDVHAFLEIVGEAHASVMASPGVKELMRSLSPARAEAAQKYLELRGSDYKVAMPTETPHPGQERLEELQKLISKAMYGRFVVISIRGRAQDVPSFDLWDALTAVGMTDDEVAEVPMVTVSASKVSPELVREYLALKRRIFDDQYEKLMSRGKVSSEVVHADKK